MPASCHPNQTKMEKGEMPKCFQPCAPFFDMCNAMNEKSEECNACMKKHELVDYIE